MAFRRFVRGKIDWDALESVARELASRYDEPSVRVAFLDAENWLSVPLVVDDRWFVKVVTPQNATVHALLTAGRNLGAFSSGTEGFFERYDNPVEMAEHELAATRRMREIGVNAPAPVEAFEHEGCGILVLEYLPEFRTLDELDGDEAASLAPALFDALARLHDDGLGHGDLRAENVLLSGGALYFIDATKVREDGIDDARAYDLACALASLSPIVGAKAAVDAALTAYDPGALLDAREFLDFVQLRPDHDFDVAGVKGEIEQRVELET